MQFEYISEGSLNIHNNFLIFENTQISRQLSSILKYFHNWKPSIGHCDIKSDNILIVEKNFDGIYVKFANFGFFKAAEILKTFYDILKWTAPEIYLKAADPKGAANDTYSVAIDIWSLNVAVASLKCFGLPVYKKEWKRNAVAQIHAVQGHVIDKYEKQGRSELLWLIIDSMLIEDSNEKSSVNYVYDKTQKLLQKLVNKSADDDDRLIHSIPSIFGAQSAVEPEDVEKAPMFCLDIQSASDGSITPRPSMFGAQSAAEHEDPEEAPTFHLDIHVSETSQVLLQKSVVHGLLWSSENCESVRLTNYHDGEVIKLDIVETQIKNPHEEESGVFFLIRYHLGGEVQRDFEASRKKQSTRKRNWPKEKLTVVALPVFHSVIFSGSTKCLQQKIARSQTEQARRMSKNLTQMLEHSQLQFRGLSLSPYKITF